MNIILAEDGPGGQQKPEQSFSQGVILVGRNSFECDIAFDSEQYPMVSRKHAELRWQDGKWLLIDLNSSYGTYVDGRRINEPTALATGSAMQFGMDGPVMRVVWFEVTSDLAFDIKPETPEARVPPPASKSEFMPEPVQQPRSMAAPILQVPAQLDPVNDSARPPVKLLNPISWLGRELDCDVIFDASAGTVSRRHAEIRFEDGEYLLVDNNSFNGTLVNGQRISSPVPLYHGDEVQLGIGGPILKFNSPSRVPPAGSSLAGQRAVVSAETGPKTVVLKLDRAPLGNSPTSATEPQLLFSIGFDEKNAIKIGRDPANEIRLDGLQISKFHAKLTRSGGQIQVEDLGSTNGVFVNGARISRQMVTPTDSVQIGTFLIRVDAAENIGVFDTRSKTRIDCVAISREVRNRRGRGKIKLLDGISLSIQPNEFVGLLGPSGAGKSTLMEAMSGVRPATGGNVRINNLDLYRHIDSLKQAIGYVPQDDIIHRELTVYRTLYFVAKLRLSRDVSSGEIRRMIDEVLDVTGLADRRDTPVHQLSGGQRKRVSTAVELVTKPSVIFLDEPTSGLDPATEDKIMRLFRQIADSGRTVVMTTHAMENVSLFDKVAVLMRGKLVFFGKPEDALVHLNAKSFKDLYDRLEEPVENAIREHGEADRPQITDRIAEEWRQKYVATPVYRELVEIPLKDLGTLPQAGAGKKRRLGIFGSISQLFTLSRRYFEVLIKDRLNLFILFAQAPVIALLTYFVMGSRQPRDFLYFVISLVAIWFGTSVSAREIIRERPVYKRERMFNLGIMPYLMSKLFVLGLIVFVQCVLLFVPLKFFDLTGLMPMPGELAGIPQFWAMLLTASVGISIGLLVSALFRSQEIASSLVPLILIPQILFSGLVGVPEGVNKVVGLTMPAAWSFDTMKRFSTLETLEPEGADPRDSTRGLGLYKFIETENQKILEKARRDIDDFKQLTGSGYQEGTTNSGNSVSDRLAVPDMKKIPEDLSGYVTFLHPWMNEVLNQLVLMLMFGIIILVTLIVLRIRDIFQ
jgi:ABC-type multidrug transport system ATPase subunit/predicted component of type VI protein secretion system